LRSAINCPDVFRKFLWSWGQALFPGIEKNEKEGDMCEGLSFNLKLVVRLVLPGLCVFTLGRPPFAFCGSHLF
jgi:hypothetical protein